MGQFPLAFELLHNGYLPLLEVNTILVSFITAGFAFLGVYMSNRKQAALVAHRLEKLEEKVDKHNSVVERMCRLEETVKNLQAEMKDLKGV